MCVFFCYHYYHHIQYKNCIIKASFQVFMNLLYIEKVGVRIDFIFNLCWVWCEHM